MNWKNILLLVVVILAVDGLAAENAKLPVIAHWSFDNDNGKNILVDSGPYKLDALLESEAKNVKVCTAKGMCGQALVLSDSPIMRFVVQNKDGWLDLKPPYTICSWAKVTSDTPSSMCVFCRKGDSEITGYDLRISWTMLNYRWGNGKDDLFLNSPPHMITLNKWYHVAVINDGKILSIFINGDKVAEKNATDNDIAPLQSKNPAVIGNYIGCYDAYNFIGMIDELYIIGKALSPDELFALAAPKDS